MTIDDKTAEYLQGLLKLPHVGSRGVETSFLPYMVVPRSSWIIIHGHGFDSSIPYFDK